VYFSNATACAGYGKYGRARPCTCPPGACCPGGLRLFPLPGYWAADEFSLPSACTVQGACRGAAIRDNAKGQCVLVPGAQLDEGPAPSPDANITLGDAEAGGGGGINTRNCARGYTDSLCGACDEGFYSLAGVGETGTCRSCRAEEEDRAEFAALLTASAALIAFEAGCVAVLREELLYLVISSLIGLQQFVVVGSANMQDLPEWAASLFASLSFFNWDIRFIKPGCDLFPRVSLEAVFSVTLLVFGLAALLFVLAAWVRSRIVMRADKPNRRAKMMQDHVTASTTAANTSGASDLPFPPSGGGEQGGEAEAKGASGRPKTFKRRATHGLVILGCLAYLQLCQRVVTGLYCSQDAAGTLRVVASPDVLCYQGSHMALALVLGLFVPVVIIGFPLWAVYISHKSAYHRDGAQFLDPKRAQKYGYLYRGARRKFWWVRSVNFPILLALALRPVTGRFPAFFFIGLYVCHAARIHPCTRTHMDTQENASYFPFDSRPALSLPCLPTTKPCQTWSTAPWPSATHCIPWCDKPTHSTSLLRLLQILYRTYACSISVYMSVPFLLLRSVLVVFVFGRRLHAGVHGQRLVLRGGAGCCAVVPLLQLEKTLARDAQAAQAGGGGLRERHVGGRYHVAQAAGDGNNLELRIGQSSII